MPIWGWAIPFNKGGGGPFGGGGNKPLGGGGGNPPRGSDSKPLKPYIVGPIGLWTGPT